MAETTPPNYGTRAPSAISGTSPNISSYWQALVDAAKTGTVKITADSNGNRYVRDANGTQVFALPGENGSFVSGAVTMYAEDAVANLSNLSPGETRSLEKSLGLKPTGAIANPALVRRYISEANKASVNNLQSVLAFQNKTIGQFTRKPLNPVAQAQISIKTGDVDGGGARRSRSISITQFSEGDARAILEQFYGEAVGRRPTDKEVKKFNSLINAQAKKQPSTSTTSYGADGSATTVSGGAGYSQADAQIAARKMAEADPEASSFLASTRYLDAFMDAIGSQA